MSAKNLNKTELIREALKANPGGMTPGDLWRAVKTEIPRRNYVYAVLGRLKDRDQVTVRRGKYFFRAVAKPEVKQQEDHGMQIQ